MSEKTIKIIYWITTGILSLLMLGSGVGYFFNYSKISGIVQEMGFPLWIIYPLGIAKILGVVAIVTRLSPSLKEWAYAGFTFNLLLASAAHYNVADGEHMGPLIPFTLLMISYFTQKRVFPNA